MTQRRLTSFYASFQGRTDLLLSDFLLTPACLQARRAGISVGTLLVYSRAFLVNRFFHLWSEFCRHVVTASSLGGYRTLNGVLLTNAQGIGSVSDILHTIKETSITGPGLRWGDPVWTMRMANKIRPTNLQEIQLGVGAVPYDDVRRVRNFIIHSNPHTRLEFDSVAVKHALIGVNADELLLHRLAGGGTLMESWIREFQHAALNSVR